MTDIDPAARARGQTIREPRLVRARAIRRRIIGGAVALFVASWLFITLVLVTGHDPVLASKAAATTVASTPSSTSTATSSGTSGTSSSSSTSQNSASSGGVSSITTSQS